MNNFLCNYGLVTLLLCKSISFKELGFKTLKKYCILDYRVCIKLFIIRVMYSFFYKKVKNKNLYIPYTIDTGKILVFLKLSCLNSRFYTKSTWTNRVFWLI